MAAKPLKDQSKFAEEIPGYLDSLAGRTEATRRDRFLSLLRDYFGIVADELEKTLKVGGVGARIAGRLDALAGNVVFEFKDELTPGKLAQARDQLAKYSEALAQSDDRRVYTLIATDGDTFQPYLSDPSGAGILPASGRVSISTLHGRAYFWLDDWVASRLKAAQAPNAESINHRLGTESAVFLGALGMLRREWATARKENLASYKGWESSIIQVYGENLANEELFLRHTYITAAAKVLAYCAVHTADSRRRPRSEGDLLDVITGTLRRFGVLNLGEHDFFAWIGSDAPGLNLVKGLFDVCGDWDFSSIPEDLLRRLYESLVDPETRHFLGEYYTPPWLAELLVEEALPTPGLTTIDPACGSGTFLVAAIHRKIAQGEDLTQVLREVVGVDVHPVAVTVARTGYLLAIQSLLRNRGKTSSRFSIPVYLSNSIQLRQSKFRQVLSAPGVKVRTYELSVPGPGGKSEIVPVPSAAVEGVGSETILDEMQRGVASGSWAAVETAAQVALAGLSKSDAGAEIAVLKVTFDKIEQLHQHHLNGIQVFLIRNYFRPATFLHAFDRVVGNPPWIVYNSLKDAVVQEDVKKAFREEQLMPLGRVGHIVTQLDVSALFFVRCANLYLKPDGRIRFLMPVTVLSKRQFAGFRGRQTSVTFDRVWDFSKVPGIFAHVQTCAIGAILSSGAPVDRVAIPTERVVSTTVSRSAHLADVRGRLSSTSTELRPTGDYYRWTYPEDDSALLHAEKSPYHTRIRNGASMFPFGLTFVDVVVDPVLGFDRKIPAVRTGQRGLRQPRKLWRGIDLTGAVEGRFLFEVASMSEIIPFGHLPLPMAALPLLVRPSKEGSDVLDSKSLLSAGYPEMSAYFGKEEAIWGERQPPGKRSAAVPFHRSIDYQGKLSRHPFDSGFIVAIPNAARVILAAVIPQGPRTVTVSGSRIEVQGVVVEHGNNYLYTRDEDEANYLAAILNSSIVNNVSKPAGLRGADTERNTGKDIFNLPIPVFAPRNKAHGSLAQLGRECATKVDGLLSGPLQPLAARGDLPANLGKLRRSIFAELGKERARIDKLVSQILV